MKPGRQNNVANAVARRRAELWWQHGSAAKELYEAVSGLRSVLVTGSQAAKYLAFAALRNGMIYSSNLNVFAFETMSAFAMLQSRIHENWALSFGSTMKDDPVYTPTTCFEAFPFPLSWDTDPALEVVGRDYYDYRAALMVRNDDGLTKTYNRFHDPDETSPGILRLRALHEAMDRAVLDAYGWTDLRPTCDFLLDYEDEDDENDAPGRARQRKKPWRYRWPDDIRDEVLARLLALNSVRFREEQLAGGAGGRPTQTSPPAPTRC